VCLGHGVFNEVASPYSTKQSRCHFGLALQKSNCVKRAARQQHQVHVRGHPLHKRIKCNGEEFDGYEIIVESVQPAPGSMWPPNVLVSKDGIESPRRYDFDTEYRKSDEATRAGVEVGRVFVRGIGRYHRLSGICNVMPEKAWACFVSRFLVVAPTTFVPVYPQRFLTRLRFPAIVPLSCLDSPRASNADPFSCLFAQNAGRLFSFTPVHNRLIGGIEQRFGANRQRATVLHACNV